MKNSVFQILEFVFFPTVRIMKIKSKSEYQIPKSKKQFSSEKKKTKVSASLSNKKEKGQILSSSVPGSPP